MKEDQFKQQREAHPEATREQKPLQLLYERTPNPKAWTACIADEHNRSWMYMAHDRNIHQSDFQQLQNNIEWLDVHGSQAVTRKTMWFVKEGCKCHYNYGKQSVEGKPFPPWFTEMSKRWLQCFNLNGQDQDSNFPDAVNLNLYENGDHVVAWHSDDEPLFQGKTQDTRIISVSLGSARKFQTGFKAPRRGGILKPEKGSIASFTLGHGQLSTMEGLFQKHYLHQIAKAGSTNRPRINATFRYIVQHAPGCPLAKRW